MNLNQEIEYKPENDGELIVPTPNNPPWNSWMAIGLWVTSVFFILLFPTLFIVPYVFTLENIDKTNQTAITEFLSSDPTAALIQILSIIPAHIFTILLAWFIVTKFNEFSFKQTLGWEWGGFNWWKCLVILIGLFALAAGTSYFFPEQDNDLLKLLRSSRMAVFAIAFLATFSAPIIEEVVYRGVLYSAFQRTVNAPFAVILVTFLFTIVHVPQYWGSPSTIFVLLILSLVLTLVRVYTNNLLPCILLHFLINGFQSIMLILEPYLPIPDSLSVSPEQAAIIIYSIL